MASSDELVAQRYGWMQQMIVCERAKGNMCATMNISALPEDVIDRLMSLAVRDGRIISDMPETEHWPRHFHIIW